MPSEQAPRAERLRAAAREVVRCFHEEQYDYQRAGHGCLDDLEDILDEYEAESESEGGA